MLCGGWKGEGGMENREQDWPVRALDSEMKIGSRWFSGKLLAMRVVNVPGHQDMSRLTQVDGRW
jgi:hypothetical protein